MKVVAKIKAFFQGEIIKPGQVVNIKSDVVPSWATVLKNKKTEEKAPVENNEKGNVQGQNDNVQNTNVNKGTGEKAPVENQNSENSTTVNVSTMEAQELASKTESELSAILDELLTQALDKGIEIDLEKQSVIESIIELRTKLKEVKE